MFKLLIIGSCLYASLVYSANLGLISKPYLYFSLFSLTTLGSKTACYYSVVEKDRPFLSAFVMNFYSFLVAFISLLLSDSEIKWPSMERLQIIAMLGLFGYWQFYTYWKESHTNLNKQTWMFVENLAEFLRDLRIWGLMKEKFIKKWAMARMVIQVTKAILIDIQRRRLNLALLINLSSLKLVFSRFLLAYADLRYSALGSESDVLLDQILLSLLSMMFVGVHYLFRYSQGEPQGHLREVTWEEWVSVSMIGVTKSFERLAAVRIKKIDFFLWLGGNRFVHCLMESLFHKFDFDTFRWDYLIDGCSYILSGSSLTSYRSIEKQIKTKDSLIIMLVYLSLLLLSSMLTYPSSYEGGSSWAQRLIALTRILWFVG